MKKLLTILGAVTLISSTATTAVSCQGSGKEKIGLIVSTQTNPYFQTMIDEAKKYLADKNYALDVYSSNDAADTELTNAQNAITKGDKGIIINPVNSKNTKSGEAILKANIPMVTVDRGFAGNIGDSSYSTDNVKAEQKMFDLVKKFVDAKNSSKEEESTTTIRAYILRGTPGSDASNDRYKGFVGNNEKSIIKVGSETANFSLEEANTKITQKISEFTNDNIDVLFSENDEMAAGALKALTSNAEGKKWLNNGGIIVGFDGVDVNYVKQASTWGEEKKEQIFATIAQRPEEMVKQAIDRIIEALDKKDAKKEYASPVAVDVKLISKWLDDKNK